jgi:hypothetical protein
MPNVIFEGVRILLEVDEKYIQLDDLDDAAVRSLWPRLLAEYPGFTVDFCYHNNIAPVAFLAEINAVMEDDCIELHLNRNDLVDKPKPVGDVVAVTETNFDAFAALHDEKNPNVYWTGARLGKEPLGWDILALTNGDIISGYVLVRSGWEVYFLFADSTENMVVLLNAAVCRGFAALEKSASTKEREILYNVSRDEHMQLDAALQIGFRRTGYYVGYSAKAVFRRYIC